jgi:hypothetical protein
MRNPVVLASLALCGLYGPLQPVHASHVAVGETCGFSSLTDPSTPGVQTGSIHTGTVVATTPADPVVVVCTVQVDLASTHADPDAAVNSAGSVQAASITPNTVSYPWTPGTAVYVCTEWIVAGTVHYYDAPSAGFTTSPTATCAPATVQPAGPSAWSHEASGTGANV